MSIERIAFRCDKCGLQFSHYEDLRNWTGGIRVCARPACPGQGGHIHILDKPVEDVLTFSQAYETLKPWPNKSMEPREKVQGVRQ